MADKATIQTWEGEGEQLETAFGLEAAGDRAWRAGEEVDAIGNRIAALKATTPAGLMFKADYLAERDDPVESVTESIINDLLEMA